MEGTGISMKCPNCGNEIEDGKLLCEQCGEEIKIVPDYDIELEAQLSETISNMAENIGDTDIKADGAEETEENTEEDFTKEDSDKEDFDEDNEELKESLKDYYRDTEFSHLNKKLIIAAGAIAAIIVVGFGISRIIMNSRNNSFGYQYDKAIECAAADHYDEAIIYLERAIALDADATDARFLLAKYYDKNGQQQSAITVLLELLNLQIDNKEEIYDYLLSIYEERMDYQKMGELLKECESEAIISKYNKYAALEPIFNTEGGVYDELISLTLEGNTEGFVYYTLDGSTPTTNSLVYESPILLESGDYTIKAFFVNMYGVSSEVVTKTYYISLSEPEEPVISLDSGTFDEPQFIEIYHDTATKIFYTLDGTVPTSKSYRYTEPIEMPYGISNFSIVAINEDGLASAIVKRTYQLYINANFSTDLAIQVLINNLWANGELADTEGHVPDKLGVNQYHVETAVKLSDTIYYIVREEYVDTTGSVHDTNNLYAIDVNTADLYIAYKIGEGKYNLKALSE